MSSPTAAAAIPIPTHPGPASCSNSRQNSEGHTMTHLGIARIGACVAALALFCTGPSLGQAPPLADQPVGHGETPAPASPVQGTPVPNPAIAAAAGAPPTVVTTPITADVTVTDKQLLNADKNSN